MRIESVEFQGHRCFRNGWAGFAKIKPINLIIGRNNTGKSHLVDLIEALCSEEFYKIGKRRGWKFRCQGTLDEQSLKTQFTEEAYPSPGGFWSRWILAGRFLNGHEMVWETDQQGNPQAPVVKSATQQIENAAFRGLDDEDYGRLRAIAKSARHVLAQKTFRRLVADRDIRPEKVSRDLALSPSGEGATNIVRRYIHSSSPKVSRDLIQEKLLSAVKEIFGKDGHFQEIQAQHHDEGDSGPLDSWEVYLKEERKGLIALSRSGSGLKTVLLVLLNLLVIPEVESKQKGSFVFAFEELENNLHPALQRRLLRYIEDYATRESATIFLTTHSNVALDLFGLSTNAQIVHVSHDGESAVTSPVSAHFDHLGVIAELGAKPSDLLQANGIIWVEGPSDRIYINRWIELFGEGKWREGRDFQCAFYGGSLLARVEFKSPGEADDGLANLLRLNSNIVVVCDSDRLESGAAVKDRVARIQTEVGKIPNAHIWVTVAKEIENYLPGSVLAKSFNEPTLPDPGQYDAFFARIGTSDQASYFETNLKRKMFNKMELALLATPHMTKDLMSRRFDLSGQMQAIVEKIRLWNA